MRLSSFPFCCLFQGSRHSKVEENKDEDELLVNVPGSAYSIRTASQERGNSEPKTSDSDVLGEPGCRPLHRAYLSHEN